MNIADFKRNIWLAYKGIHQSFNASSQNEKRALFVAGNQRSGTNMFMDILERSIETAVFHETDKKAFSQYLMRDRETIKSLVLKSKARIVAIKALCESQDIPDLLSDFPNSKAIWMARHYDGVVKSMKISFPKHRELMLKIGQDKTCGTWRTEKMDDETYQEIIPFINDSMTDSTAAVLQWYFRNKLYFQLNLQERADVHLITYEDTVLKPQETLGKVCDFLGLDFTPYMIKDIYSQSVKTSPLPDIDEGAKELCDALWQRIQQHKQ